MYIEQDLVRIAKRENNNKRKYLVMNRLQGKHIPVKPHEAFEMFHALSDTLRDKYKNERLLLIGFAETATAIGAAVAAELEADYIQTTRETIPDAEYLYFSEEHSHATEQKLVRGDIDSVINDIDRIIFIEDEVTTGKTILNIINIMKNEYHDKLCFAVASILNGMNESALETYKEQGIELYCLVKTNHAGYTAIADAYRGDGRYVVCAEVLEPVDIQYIKINEMMNTRHIVHSREYSKFCETLFQNISSRIKTDNSMKILVLGTEEFMYPALYCARRFEENGKNVKFHATTRSPIAVSTEEDYPLCARYELKSLYDSERTTYIYNLEKYDMVVIISDAQGNVSAGVNTLVAALAYCGNENIICVQCT